MMKSILFLSLDANGNVDPEAPPANYGRRRSRAVLYQLSGHYTKDNRRKSKLKLNNVSDERILIVIKNDQTSPMNSKLVRMINFKLVT